MVLRCSVLVASLEPGVTAGAAVAAGAAVVVAAVTGAVGLDFTASAASAGATSIVVAINATANFRIMELSFGEVRSG